MTNVTAHVAGSAWCVHFVITATQIPVGPWLLFDSSDEIRAKVFKWGNVTTEQLAQYEIDHSEPGNPPGCNGAQKEFCRHPGGP